MLLKVKKLILKSRKRVIPAVAAVAVLGLCGAVFANSVKNGSDFQPDDSGNSQNIYEDANNEKAFDGQQSGQDGTSINQNTEEQKKLEDGNAPVQKPTNPEEQFNVANPNTTSGDKVPADSNGSTNGNGTPVQPVNPTDDTGDGTGSGGNGTGTGDGTGTNNGNNEGGGSGDSGNSNGSGDNGTITTPTQTPQPTATPNRNYVHNDEDASYGEGEGDKTADSLITDNMTGGSVTTLSVVRSDASETIWMYPGKQPTPTLMEKYITVNTTVAKENMRYKFDNIQYSFKNDKNNYGGDYAIDWDINENGQQDEASHIPGKHTARVIVLDNDGNARTINKDAMELQDTFNYEVYDYKIELLDFEEDFAGNNDVAFTQNPGMGSGGLVNLTDAIARMNQKLQERTNSGKGYKHKLVKDANGALLSYFPGWSDVAGGDSVGNSYQMKDIAQEDLQKASDDTYYYEIKLYPAWVELGNTSNGFTIGTTENGELTILDYQGDHSTVKIMDVPDGVSKIDFSLIAKGGTFTSLKLVNIPASVKEIILPKNMDAYSKVENFGVSKDNLYYMDVDGVLYDKSGTQLLKVPANKTSIKAWSKKLTTITSDSFANIVMDEVEFPDTTTTFEKNSLSNASFGTLGIMTKEQWPLKEYVLQPMGDENLSVDHLVIADTEEDSLYVKFLTCLFDWFEEKGDSSFAKTAMKFLDTKANVEENYVYKDGWLLGDKGAKIVVATQRVDTNDFEIPEGVTTLATGFMEGEQFQGVTEITLPDTIATVCDGAFQNTNLTAIYFTSNTAPTLSGAGKMFGNTIPRTIRVYVPDTKYNDYYSLWERFARRGYGANTTDEYMLPYGDKVTSVGGCDYWENEEGKYILVDGRQATGAVELLAGTTKIGKYAFYGNDAVSSLTIPEDLDEIGTHAFDGGRGLTSIVVKNGLRVIGDYAFNSCVRLGTFQWTTCAGANQLETIGTHAFDSCGLTGLPNTTTGSVYVGIDSVLASYTSCVIFEGTYSRSKANLFSNLKTIGDSAFANNRRMSIMSIPVTLSFGEAPYTTWEILVKAKWSVWFGYGSTKPVGKAAEAIDGGGSGGGGDEGGEII